MAEPVSYGGQAVVEGVMMRGPRHFAVACRRTDGTITVQQEEVPAFFTRYAWARWPFLRGIFALADAMVLGMKSLLYSANLALADQQEEDTQGDSKDQPGPPSPPPVSPLTQVLIAPLHLMLGTGSPTGPIGSLAVTGTAVTGMALGIGLFMLFPSVVAGWTVPFVGDGLAPRLIEGAIRVALVLGYITLIGRMKEVQRLFQYHGAEHKAINALEAEGVVTVDGAMRASRIHPRCGTNFVLTVLLVKALVFTALPFQSSLLVRLGLRLALLPLVGSLSYEVIRLAGRFREVAPFQWLVLPGLLTQRLTTREPDRGMVEVAVASLEAVLVRDPATQTSGAQPAAVIA